MTTRTEPEPSRARPRTRPRLPAWVRATLAALGLSRAGRKPWTETAFRRRRRRWREVRRRWRLRQLREQARADRLERFVARMAAQMRAEAQVLAALEKRFLDSEAKDG